MERMFCYEHERMAFKAGYDYYQSEVFYCEKGKHYLLRNGESKRHVNLYPRRIQPTNSLDEKL